MGRGTILLYVVKGWSTFRICPQIVLVTGSWDRASLYALWTGVSSGTSLIRDVVVASAVSIHVFQIFVFHGHLLMDSEVGTL